MNSSTCRRTDNDGTLNTLTNKMLTDRHLLHSKAISSTGRIVLYNTGSLPYYHITGGISKILSKSKLEPWTPFRGVFQPIMATRSHRHQHPPLPSNSSNQIILTMRIIWQRMSSVQLLFPPPTSASASASQWSRG